MWSTFERNTRVTKPTIGTNNGYNAFNNRMEGPRESLEDFSMELERINSNGWDLHKRLPGVSCLVTEQFVAIESTTDLSLPDSQVATSFCGLLALP
ncbi:GD24957 [Drosophila simulans]|uniref:GD24957 n=1 Tax=Drosophila simulans TaxID=7240 RepID=B4NV10_DROSI|nr:GD24957 [Drosophila simulans]